MAKTNRKPCWWCGNAEIGIWRAPAWDKHQAYCTKCAAAGPLAGSKSVAVRKWNQGPRSTATGSVWVTRDFGGLVTGICKSEAGAVGLAGSDETVEEYQFDDC